MLSAGCATGEEAFTLAAQAMQAEASPSGLEVLGLDLCRPALESAAAGIIAPGLGDPLGLVPDALRPWLADTDGSPRLHPALRRSLDFRRANLLEGLGATGFDVIFCRNVLIYLTDQARERVMASLIAGLRPGGLLALALLTFTVNMRHLLMAASMRPWLGQLPPWQSYPALLLLADNNWAAAMRYHTKGGTDAGYFVGSGLITWVLWLVSTVAGQ
eukprot:gene12796-15641_t